MKTLLYPFTQEQVRELHVGDMVNITGKIFTGRDSVHKYLHEGNPSPVNLKNQIIYHCGPVVLQEKNDQGKKTGKYRVVAAGPTTSIREEPYQWQVIRDHGIVGVIGKGGMGQKTKDACRQYGCVYLHAIGGAAQVLAEKIKSVDCVYLEQFGSPESIWELTVEDFPVVVTIDAHGNSLHEQVLQTSQSIFKQLIDQD